MVTQESDGLAADIKVMDAKVNTNPPKIEIIFLIFLHPPSQLNF